MSNAFADVNRYFDRAAHVLSLSKSVVDQLITPYREIRVECNIRMDSGQIRTFDVRTPTKLTREQRRLFEQLRESLPAENEPHDKSLVDRFKEFFM